MAEHELAMYCFGGGIGFQAAFVQRCRGLVFLCAFMALAGCKRGTLKLCAQSIARGYRPQLIVLRKEVSCIHRESIQRVSAIRVPGRITLVTCIAYSRLETPHIEPA